MVWMLQVRLNRLSEAFNAFDFDGNGKLDVLVVVVVVVLSIGLQG